MRSRFEEDKLAMLSDEGTYEGKRIAALGQDVLADCRCALMMRFRFLDQALWKMPFVSASLDHPLATDGMQVSFDPLQTILRYRLAPHELVRDLLHSVLHCIFRHPFEEPGKTPQAWELACDITVESIAMEMCDVRFDSELDTTRRKVLRFLEKACGSLLPSKLYRMFDGVLAQGAQPLLDAEGAHAALKVEHQPKAILQGFEAMGDGTRDEMAAVLDKSVQQMGETGHITVGDLFVLEQLFARDSHCDWLCNRKRQEDQSNQSNQSNQSKSDDNTAKKLKSPDGVDSSENSPAQDGSQEPDEQVDGDVEQEKRESQSHESGQDVQALDEEEEALESDGSEQHAEQPDEGDRSGGVDFADERQALEDWEEIARQVELDLEEHSKGRGNEAGNLRMLLPVVNRTKYDYADFLRKFAISSEEMKVNDDEFDYIYYTYGLSEYGNRPFVEPLEYQDANRIRDFAIALDTSGSCSGELIRSFVDETFRILKESESFTSNVNVHIIQCDNRIQDDQVITSRRDLERYLDSFEVRGFGGTDFRPVFDYVDGLVADGKFDDLRGLIYFTDGMGTYPRTMPGYDVAFVFMNEQMVNPHVPPWAMKVVLDEDEVRELGRG